MKTIRIGGFNVTIKKLTLSDFLGCDFVPLIYSHVIPNKTHQRRSKESEEIDSISIIFDKAIIAFDRDSTKEQLITYINDNAELKSSLFEEIYLLSANSDDKYYEISGSMAYTIYKLCEKFGKLPTEILNSSINEFNLNVSILNYGATEDYKNELISNLKAHNHIVSGRETIDILEKLLESKRDRLKNG